jgi:hypothetical protein
VHDTEIAKRDSSYSPSSTSRHNDVFQNASVNLGLLNVHRLTLLLRLPDRAALRPPLRAGAGRWRPPAKRSGVLGAPFSYRPIRLSPRLSFPLPGRAVASTTGCMSPRQSGIPAGFLSSQNARPPDTTSLLIEISRLASWDPLRPWLKGKHGRPHPKLLSKVSSETREGRSVESKSNDQDVLK